MDFINTYAIALILAAFLAACASEFWFVLIGEPYMENSGKWKLSDDGAIFAFIGRHIASTGFRVLLCQTCFNVYVVAAMLLVLSQPIWLIFLAAPVSYIFQKLIWRLDQ